MHTMPGDIDIYKIATFLSLCASLTYANDAKISPRFIDRSFPLFLKYIGTLLLRFIYYFVNKQRVKLKLVIFTWRRE